jgi:hypothetical protein
MGEEPEPAARAWIEEADLPPAEVTRELFLQWRAARRGAAHPERMTNPVWAWLARVPRVNAYQVRRHFGIDAQPQGAGWTHQRFGQSRTELPDGRVVAIAGEHEDSYDPDFFIYNDVIVTSADGAIELYGYPTEVFAPTDFHSATHVGEQIVVIGNLGYARKRKRTTPIVALETAAFTIAPVEARGDDPGWLSDHTAELSSDGRRITVRGGRREIDVGGEPRLRENPDAYTFELDERVWTRDTALPWSIWELEVARGHASQLYLIGWLAGYAGKDGEWERAQSARHREQLGRLPDLAAYAARFEPPCAHERLAAADGEYDTTRIVVDGVVVRYVERSIVRIIIEGALAPDRIAAIVEDARRKLEIVEARPYVATCLDG